MAPLLATRQRQEILSHTRSICMMDYHNIMFASSGDAQEDEITSQHPTSTSSVVANAAHSVHAVSALDASLCIQTLKFDPCYISMHTCSWIKYLHDVFQMICTHYRMLVSQQQQQQQVVEETALGLDKLLPVMYHSLRDAIALYLSVIPLRHQSLLQTSFRMGAIFYNDCCYIAHNLSLMVYKYRQVLTSSKTNTAVASTEHNAFIQCLGLLDFLPRLRKLGEDCLTKHLSAFKQILTEFVVTMRITPQHQPTHQQQGAAASVNQITEMQHLCHAFTNTFSMIQDILSKRIYAKLIPLVVEDLVTQFMKPILTADCITIVGANECQQMFRLFIHQVK
jgi:hypothetical protein